MTAAVSTPPNKTHAKPEWVKIVAKYQAPSNRISAWQITNSFGPYIALWIVMYFTYGVSYLLTLALAFLAGLFVVRIFIIQHDCGHTSFLKSRKWNDRVGVMCSLVSLTPYEYWRTGHAMHHATSGDLDFRGFGDVQTHTVKEYLAMNKWQRLGYRMYRNPFVMFGFGPLYMFLINQRTPMAWKTATSDKSRRSLIMTDIMIFSFWIIMSLFMGVGKFVSIQLPIAFVAATLGVWMFYIQHQYEDAYWRYHPEWDYADAALKGSSYYKLPKVLQWFTGNIGLHHVHHLGPKIPNYLLEKAHTENELFQEAPTLTIRQSIKVLMSQLALYDEEQQRLINFQEAHDLYLPGQPA